jgi:hypothetical protein
MLGLFVPAANRRNLETSMRHSIIEPAFALARKMHLSVDEFTIEWSPYYYSRPGPQISAREFNHFEFVDLLDDYKTIKSYPSDGVRWMFDITPMLMFRKVQADSYADPKTLKRPKILAAIIKEGPGHDREPELRSASGATVLDWLETAIRLYYRRTLTPFQSRR